MIINSSTIKNIFVGLKTHFQNAFNDAPSNWEKIAMKVTSDSSEEHYWWLSRFPKLKKWVGTKVIKALSAYKYTIVNEPFEATVEVDKHHIKDNQLVGYAFQAQQAGKSAAEWPGDLVFGLLANGFINLCYDGQPFFDTDHPVNGQSVSNKGKKALRADSLATAKASYGVARQTMRSFKDEEGAPLKIKPSVLIVPPALEDTANYLMTAEKFPDGSINIYRGTAEVMVVDELTSDTQWFLLDTNQIIKPLIFQEREKVDFVSQTSMDSDDVFDKGVFKFGCEARGNAGYGFWQMAYGSTGEQA